ncbi:hypothetical protein [Enterovibrio coralii]|uniref:Uncharacterized protein n=1 Tax=Enterovibrio coralii TaxID=294935 RepID=A0A135I5C1_9GAMM|nr:hypothetical protein [Enterovibrio coralii]KXF80648.1 hypothetical protein ATN88_08350 [Enterovibrio coralii]
MIIIIEPNIAMNDWMHLLRTGNQFFSSLEYNEAEDSYFDALTLLNNQQESVFSQKEKLFGWLACHHNLSAVYKLDNQLQLARFHLETPLEVIEGYLKTTPPEESFFIELLKAYQTGLNELYLFEKDILETSA